MLAIIPRIAIFSPSFGVLRVGVFMNMSIRRILGNGNKKRLPIIGKSYL
jgi:hypothetical protein